jgi:hypothetical protein
MYKSNISKARGINKLIYYLIQFFRIKNANLIIFSILWRVCQPTIIANLNKYKRIEKEVIRYSYVYILRIVLKIVLKIMLKIRVIRSIL